MTARDVTITTPDGTCTAGLHVPQGDGPWPAVIMVPDIGSRRPAFVEMGERLAAAGYVVLVPDIYYRDAPYAPFDTATLFTSPDEFPRAKAMAGQITPDAVASDARAWIAFLHEQPEVADVPVGTTGYCFGGKLSLTIAGQVGDLVGAAASFHGGGLAAADDPTSPHLFAEGIRARVYVGAAADDRSFPAEQEERLRAALEGADVAFELETYDAAHGFAVTDFSVFDQAASDRHWAAMERLYGEALG